MGSRLSSKGLDVHIHVLTFLASFASTSSFTSPDLFFDAAGAFFAVFTASFAVSTTADVVDARRPDRRSSGMSVPSAGGAALRGILDGRIQTGGPKDANGRLRVWKRRAKARRSHGRAIGDASPLGRASLLLQSPPALLHIYSIGLLTSA
jgi:hypothetical protein